MKHEAPSAWLARARQAIPGGASTGSKRADALFGDALDAHTPTHMRRAYGCRLETADGRVLVDTTMALGAVAFGYADAEVTRAVQEAAALGPVGGLSPVLEIEVAERLIDVIPCAEQVRFLKTGAEATTAAVRIARAATGRDTVIASGYFGWHDWSNSGAGIPAAAHADVQNVPFDDVAALDVAVEHAGRSLAAIVLEPLVHHVASRAWLEAARAHCDRLGAVLVFDEIKTAFRMRTGGVQELTGITPDLTSLGKAMANGYALSAVVGRRDVMDAARAAWISSTLASECTGLAAARAVLDRHAREDVCAALDRTGNHLQQCIREALGEHGASLGVSLDGPAPMLRLVAVEQGTLDALVVACAHEGVLLKRGAYLFAALAHDADALHTIGVAVAAGAARVAAHGHGHSLVEREA